MMFVRTFKGYEDKTSALDAMVNDWISANHVDVVTVKTAMSHDPTKPQRQGSALSAGSGDLIYTVVYKADSPVTQ